MRIAVLINLLLLAISGPAWADTKIAVPDFELLDLTIKLSDPEQAARMSAQESKRVELIDTLLREGIANSKGFSLLPLSTEARNAADKGVGYLFECPSCSAQLGRDHGADYILMGRLHKPTYLFSYIIVRVVDTAKERVVAEFKSEVKGNPEKSIPGAIDNLVIKIEEALPH